jgi:hypothetical protein
VARDGSFQAHGGELSTAPLGRWLAKPRASRVGARSGCFGLPRRSGEGGGEAKTSRRGIGFKFIPTPSAYGGHRVGG